MKRANQRGSQNYRLFNQKNFRQVDLFGNVP